MDDVVADELLLATSATILAADIQLELRVDLRKILATAATPTKHQPSVKNTIVNRAVDLQGSEPHHSTNWRTTLQCFALVSSLCHQLLSTGADDCDSTPARCKSNNELLPPKNE